MALHPALPRCVLVLAHEHRWEHHLLRKLSLRFSVVAIIHATQTCQRRGYGEFTKYVASVIKEGDVQIVFMCLDFCPAIDVSFIRALPAEAKRVLITFDDILMHEVNAINASACDMVLSGDPVAVLRYKEKCIHAEFMALEASSQVYRNRHVNRDIDVLFFGSQAKADRRHYLMYLKERGVRVAEVGDGPTTYMEPQELGQYISRAKIVLNFSKTDNLQTDSAWFRAYRRVAAAHHPFKWYLQFKGRIIEAALSHTVCVSEDAPAIHLLFPDGEVPVFDCPEECLAILTDLLANDAKRMVMATRLYNRALACYEDSVQMARLAPILMGLPGRRDRAVAIPHWYYELWIEARLAALPSLCEEPLKFVSQMRLLLAQRSGITLRRFTTMLVMTAARLLWLYTRRLSAKTWARTRSPVPGTATRSSCW